MILRIFGCGYLTLISLTLGQSFCLAQQDDVNTIESDVQVLQEKFNSMREEFRNCVSEVQRLGVSYVNATSLDEAYPFLDDFDSQVEKGNELLERWKTVGIKLFDLLDDNKQPIDEELAYFVSITVSKFFNENQYEKAYQLASKLFKNNPKNKIAEIFQARSGILTNRFGNDIALLIKANKDHFQQEDAVTAAETVIINNLYVLDARFKKELEIREKEAQADDLPLVLLETSKGDIEFELFEDSAPDMVGNFIHLVENKHYDGLIFHGVIQMSAAETGLFDSEFKKRELDYKIFDEKPTRDIFAGSVVMISESRNSADSRFFIATAPLPNVSGKQTVIGRVKNGMEVVYSLNNTHEMQEDEVVPVEDVVADQIRIATVTRKRDHQYTPRKVSAEK